MFSPFNVILITDSPAQCKNNTTNDTTELADNVSIVKLISPVETLASKKKTH
jgi:hypothetical protein